MQNDKDPGLGSKFSHPVKRLLNANGTYNINRIGGLHGLRDFYIFLQETSRVQFALFLFSFYITINLVFALLYLGVGLGGLQGLNPDIHPFLSAFFFSCQTLTTLGFGGVFPNNMAANIVSSVEAFVGLLSIALATGLLYGRFSKPKTRIAFSTNILLNQLNDEPAVMFKMVNLRHNVLLRTNVSCIFILDESTADRPFYKTYHKLKLETDFVLFFPLSWTLVHKITESSPLYGLTIEEIKRKNGEVVVFLETFDETFSQEVVQKHSYAGDQWLEKVKFDMMFESTLDGKIDLHISRLNNISPQ